MLTTIKAITWFSQLLYNINEPRKSQVLIETAGLRQIFISENTSTKMIPNLTSFDDFLPTTDFNEYLGAVKSDSYFNIDFPL